MPQINTDISFLTRNDLEMRKLWVYSLWGLFALSLFNISSTEIFTLRIWFFWLIGAIIGFALNYLTYHCAYKKNGTILLTLILMANVIIFMTNTYNINDFIPNIQNPISLLAFIRYPLKFLFVIFSLVLIQTNRKIERVNTIETIEYPQILAELRKSPTLYELDLKLLEATRNWPIHLVTRLYNDVQPLKAHLKHVSVDIVV